MLLAIAASVLVLGGVAVVTIGLRLTPLVRARALAAVRDRFDSDVELGDFNVTVLPHISASGSGLVLRKKGMAGLPPLIQIQKFSAHAGLIGLLNWPIHFSSIHLDGLAVHVPPRAARDRLAAQDASKPRTDEVPRVELVIDEITTDDASIEILPNEPGKPSHVFLIHHLIMDPVGFDRPATFRATLTNPRPRGEITTQGQFGPWHRHNPGETPIAATYNFEHADLGTFNGIAGILSSKGKFGGILDHINVEGETDTPDFAVRLSGHPVPLHTQFEAVVDGTNGNTYLNAVHARLLHTEIECSGSVTRTSPGSGHTVLLDIEVTRGRIEDILRLATKAPRPLMTGPVSFKTKFNLPPGKADVTQRLQLNGAFSVNGGRFTKLDIEQKLKSLSRHAKGEPQDEEAGSAVTQLRGNFALRNGTVSFSKFSFGVPGAVVALAGKFALASEELDFHGKVRLQATLSQMTTGWKSVLLKAVDPFFKKNGAGTELPIKITGTREHPSYGLDFFRQK